MLVRKHPATFYVAIDRRQIIVSEMKPGINIELPMNPVDNLRYLDVADI